MVAVLLWLVTALVVFAIAAAAVGTVSGRLAAEPPKNLFDLDEAVDVVADRLPDEVTAVASYDDVRTILQACLDLLEARGLASTGVPEVLRPDTVAGPVAPGLMDTMVDECLRTPAATWRGAFAALLEDDFSTELHEIQVPVLLPWGDADVFSPESDQQRLQRQLPRATRVVYAGVGHALHWEQPRRFADELMAFERTLGVPCL